MAKKKDSEDLISELIIKEIEIQINSIKINDFKNKCQEIITNKIKEWLK